MSRRTCGRALLALALAATAVATLTPAGTAPTHGISCVFCGGRAAADALLNVLLFVPVGIGVRLLGTRTGRAVLIGVLISAAIEFVQIVLPGRDASVGDVIANGAGTAVGVALVATAPLWLRPGPRAAPFLASGWALLAGIAWCGTGWILAPSFPETAYASLWAPDLTHLEWYRGQVLEVTIGNVASPYERVADSRALRRRLLERPPIAVLATTALRPPGLAPIFAVYDEYGEEIVLLGPDRENLVFRYRTRATDFRLDQPDVRVRWPETGAEASGDTVSLAVSPEPGGRGYCVRIDASERCGVGFTAGDGWTLLLYPESFPPRVMALLRVVWIAAVTAPVGLWVLRTSHAILPGVVLAFGLVAAPVVTVLLPTPPSQWAAMLAGLGAGIAVRRVLVNPRRS